jgi:hypothetical protein
MCITLRPVVGSQTSRRMALSQPPALQNSQEDGGRIFLIFVADPRTRSCPPVRSAERTALLAHLANQL